jgi:putative addiction module killer protein
VYEIEQTEVFSTWLHGLKDSRAKARIRARVERAGRGNFGDWSPEGGEIRAMRIDYGSGYRLYFTIRSSRVIFLLCGGDKSTQKADIRQAHKLVKEHNK